MADTEKDSSKALRADEDPNEYFSSSATIAENVRALAALLQSARGTGVVYTGAGVSTSSGIPDYRGPNGVWTLRAQGVEVPRSVTLEAAVPTVAHTVVAELVAQQLFRGVVSTNIDNLHRRSGVRDVVELHGNCFLERCADCKAEVWREFDCTAPRGCQPDHRTGRSCEACGGALLDTIVHFKEPLPADTVARAREATAGAAVAVVLGTSLRVRPASDLPLLADKLFIVNLQKTPHDKRAVVTRCRTDLFMALLARELRLPTQPPVEEGWEAQYDARAAENAAKEQAFSRKALAQLVTPQLQQFRPQQKNEVCDLNGAEAVDVSPTAGPRPVMIRNCRDCSLRLTNNHAVKVVLLECHNVTLIVSGRILTGVLEIINCAGVNVAVCKALPTIQIDRSTDVGIGFLSGALSGSVLASANSTVSIAPRKDLPPERLVFAGVPENDEFARGMTQFITRIQDDSTLLTELVVHEGNGYATTQREKDAADLKDKKVEEALVKYISSMIH